MTFKRMSHRIWQVQLGRLWITYQRGGRRRGIVIWLGSHWRLWPRPFRKYAYPPEDPA